ncbi:DKNYY domain-containing protein [Aquimarina sp. RZ0]|uniref:DKNYY domain-containing protein n=1 Tax=Aquimarina sp. RZ0 TaxID=2607730 RepID=UPI0011F3A862|nr:hypothetical protein F0000_24135 [Aquimarina sp. RZ0]
MQFANPKTFKTLENGYTKDDKYVFKKGGEIIKKADPKTFQVLTYTYQRDKKNVFIPGEITEIDVKSFKILECNNQGRKQKSLYATDKNYAYFQGKIIPNADVKTFYLIESDAPYQTYAIDKNKVYYSGKKLKDADPTTFKLNTNKTSSNYYDAKDKNYTYIRDKKTITKNK